MNKVTVANSLLRVRRSPRENSAAARRPNTTPNTTILTNNRPPSTNVPASPGPERAMSIITKNNATVVPSLNRLSPSNIIRSRRGTPIRRNSGINAEGSIDEINELNNKATINGISNPTSGRQKYNSTATPTVDTNTPTHVNNVIDHDASNILRIFILKLESKIITGKKIYSNSSGVSAISPRNPITPSRYGKCPNGTSNSPTTTSNTVYGSFNRRATKNITVESAINTNNESVE